MISFKHRFLFVHIPKTGGNSIQNILRDYSEDHIVCLAPHHDGVERFEVKNDQFRLDKHSTLGDYRRELGEDAFVRLYKFCGVRNPWERAISFYFSPHRGLTEWNREAFVQLISREMRPITSYLTLDGTSRRPFENVDFIMRFEHLNEDFRQVCERIGLPPQDLPVRNKSTRDYFTRYYDSGLARWIHHRFAEEIEYFGYQFPGSI